MKNFINSIENTNPVESRENLKSIFAVVLGAGSWILLGWLIYSQFKTCQSFAEKLAATPPMEKDKIALIKDANETVSKTSSSLYSLLTPVATAITGYFFISGISSGKKSEVDLPKPKD
jgi:hypothetical protein